MGILALTLVVLGASACGSSAASASPSASAGSPSNGAPSIAPVDTGSAAPVDSSSAPAVPESPVAGIVIAVDTAGATLIKGFTLRNNDGDTIAFTIGTLDNPDDFPASQLKDHEASATPVFVFFREEGGHLVVYHLENAP